LYQLVTVTASAGIFIMRESAEEDDIADVLGVSAAKLAELANSASTVAKSIRLIEVYLSVV
jgi:hypothetical protein